VRYLRDWDTGKTANTGIKEKKRRTMPRRLSENALSPKLFVILKKIILGISTICLWLFFQVFLDFEQNYYPRTAS